MSIFGRLYSILLLALFSAPAALSQQLPVPQRQPETRPVTSRSSINESWNGGTGNWNTSTDWTPNGIPNNGGGNTYNVTIDTGSDTVNLNINATIASLTLGGASGSSVLENLSGTTDSLTITGALTINSTGQLLFNDKSSLTAQGGGSNSGFLDLEQQSSANITGNFTNSGTISTNRSNEGGGANSFTVSGTLTNNAGALINLGEFNDTADVMTLGGLVNNGELIVGTGSTLNLTNQPNGLTDIPSGSQDYIEGTFKAGSASALAKVGSIEGLLEIENGQSTTITPGSGTLTNTGTFDVERNSTVKISGNFTNSASFYTNENNNQGGPNNVTITGALTNNAGAITQVGYFSDTSDVLNVGTLSNSGEVAVEAGATLNLTNQPNGITDVPLGSSYYIAGSFNAVSASALAKLGSVEGVLEIENGQSTTITPGTGTFTNTGNFDVERNSTVKISGNLTNSSSFYTNENNNQGGPNNVTITGTLTNKAGAITDVGYFGDTSDVLNVGTLSNSGEVAVGVGATLNLTNQPNGITDVPLGSSYYIAGSFNAVSASALAKLGSVEGVLEIENGQSTTITPGTGTFTNTGNFDVERNSTVKISGNLTNSASLYTNENNNQGGANTVTITGALTNNAGAITYVGYFSDTSDVLNVGTLSNSGEVAVGVGATLNLTNQPNGITDVPLGSSYYIAGGFNAGSASALAKLGSVEGVLEIENGQSTAITPGSGTLTNTGTFDVERNSTVTVSGNLTNSGGLYTNEQNQVVGPNTLTVTGALTNNAGALINLGPYSDTSDVLNAGTLINNGEVEVGIGATLKLTNQPNGITDVAAGSSYYILGSFKAGTASAFAKLGSIEGVAEIENGQSTTITPGSGTLTNTGTFDVERNSTVTVSGNLTNSGGLYTNQQNQVVGPNTLTATGALTNNAGALINLGPFSDTSDVLNAGTLINNGEVEVGIGATLNLTNQPNGVTDVGAGSSYYILGSFKAGTASAFAKLGSIEGLLEIENGQSTTITPGGGTLTNTGTFDIERNSTVTVSGNLTNSASLYTNQQNQVVGPNTLTVTGALTNNSGATTYVGDYNDTSDVLNAGTLVNNGTFTVGTGATVDLTSSGTDTNSTTISLNASTLKFSGASTTLSGTGIISLSNSASNLITGVGSGITLTSANTIEGAGTISNLGLVNTGTILANQSTPLIILPNSSGLNNKGTLNVSTGDTLQIGTSAGGALVNFANNTLTGGTYLVSGTLQFGASGTSITTNDANITLTGAGSQIIDFGGNNVLANLATNAAGASFTLGAMRSFTTAGNFTNNGTLVVGGGDMFKVNGNLTNFSGTTLTGGTYKVTGTLQFNGANIVTNAANITLTGANSKILNNTGNANALANFATNAAGANFTLGAGRSFTTAGNFTNDGSLVVGTGDTFDVNGNLTNFSGTTLSGGTYNVSGTLQFNNANIVTNAADIILNGTAAKIVSQTAANALTNFAKNTGSFTISGGAALSTMGGNFTNSGTFTVSSGSTFTVGGSGFNFTQTAGTTTVDGTLQGASAGTLSVNSGSLFGGGTLAYSVVDGSTITPGDSSTKTGILSVTNTYSQNSTGALDISIGGATAGTQYDELKVTSSATLNGTLNVSLINHFTPTVGSTFDILNASSLIGTFATVNGLSINSTEHFSISYDGTEVVLTVVSGAVTDLRRSTFHNTLRHAHQGGLAIAQSSVPVAAPVSTPLAAPIRGIHRNDLPAVDPVTPISAGGLTLGPQRGYGLNALTPMPNPGLADHSYLEFGVDLKALLKSSPKRILRSFNPDSPDPVSIGYIVRTPSH